MAKHRNLHYLDPLTTMTLGDGIRELRAAEGAAGDAVENIDPELISDLDMHDAIHVLFACPTSLSGEISAHIWKLFGTTMRLQDMHRVNMHQDHRQVLADIGHHRLLWMWFKNVPYLIATLFRSFCMSRPWPAENYAEYLDVPLVELRKQFGVRLPDRSGISQSQDSAGAALRRVAEQKAIAHLPN